MVHKPLCNVSTLFSNAFSDKVVSDYHNKSVYGKSLIRKNPVRSSAESANDSMQINLITIYATGFKHIGKIIFGGDGHNRTQNATMHFHAYSQNLTVDKEGN
jgi:hypothetical protein